MTLQGRPPLLSRWICLTVLLLHGGNTGFKSRRERQHSKEVIEIYPFARGFERVRYVQSERDSFRVIDNIRGSCQRIGRNRSIIRLLGSGRESLMGPGVYNLGHIGIYQAMHLYAIRMAGVFMISTSTISLRTGIVPRGWPSSASHWP
jgi:hypothetical protein